MRKFAVITAFLIASFAAVAAILDPLVPGRNFTSLRVSGFAGSAGFPLHIEVSNKTAGSAPIVVDMTADETAHFSRDFTGLTAGDEYLVKINGEDVGALVLARDASDGWLHENADTFEGIAPGTGYWTGNGETEVQGSSIHITAEFNSDVTQTVEYHPTNHLVDARGYWVRASIMFDCEIETPRATDGIFGITLVVDPLDTTRAVFYIIDGQEWKRTDVEGEVGKTYSFAFFVDESNRRVGYYNTTEYDFAFLGQGLVPAGVPTRFHQVDFQGYGSVDAIDGEAYDANIVVADVHFDNVDGEGRVTPGTNFTNLLFTGTIAVTNLWDTDVSGGKIHFYLVDSAGVTNSTWTETWDGYTDVVAFTNQVDGLVAGAEYTVHVVAEINDAGFESQAAVDGVDGLRGTMARLDDDCWYDENGDSATGAGLSYGRWSSGAGMGISKSATGGIVFAGSDDEVGYAVFEPTNLVGRSASATSSKIRATFDDAYDYSSLPDPSGSISGISLAMMPGSDYPQIVVVKNGAWVAVPRDVFAPRAGEEYEFETFCNEMPGERGVTYYVTDFNGRQHCIASYSVPETSRVRPGKVKFLGDGEVEEFRGDWYDTSLVKVTVDFDDSLTNGAYMAGRNYTNLWLSGWVTVTNLWDTDLTSGTIRIRVIDGFGDEVGCIVTNWSGFADSYGITNFINGLNRGGNYTIEVSVDNSGHEDSRISGDNGWTVHGAMGRILDAWYDEDPETVAGHIPPTGIWNISDGISLTVASDGLIDVSTDGTVDGAKAVFTPTNPVPRNGKISVNTFDVVFPSAMDYAMLPDASGELFGISLVESNDVVMLAVVLNGSWKLVDRADFTPEIDVRYIIDAVASYSVSGPSLEYFVSDVYGDMKCVARGFFRPGSKPYPADITFSGDGRFASAVGEFVDTTLFNVDMDFGSVPGTNFVAIGVSGTITITPVWDTDLTNGTIRVAVKNGRGEIVSEQTAEFHGTTPVEITVDGLEPGESYSVAVDLIDSDGPADGEVSEDNILTPTAKKYDGAWIHENSRTFEGTEPGTGDWSYRKNPFKEAKSVISSPVGPAIQIGSDLTSSVNFNPTNEDPKILNSTVREITFELCSETPGYNISSPEYAKTRPADLAGITIACDDLHGGALHFSVYNPEGEGSWHVLTDTTAELDRQYTVTVILTYPNPNKTQPCSVGYYLNKSDGRRERIAFFEPAGGLPVISEAYKTCLRFVGSGYVKSVEGSCYDAHLASIDGLEYWTIADAVHEIGTSGRVLIPLWYSTYTADIDEGYFGVLDNNVPPYLTIIWPLGYVVEIRDDGSVRYYLFHLSDYWIDWADIEGIDTNAMPWVVKNANGLAWIARESTNSWITGEIELAEDITNLFEHIWVPIRGFTGTFDGNGRTITGLTDKGVECCWTNELNMTVYGLFGTASNSVFRNVSFADVAITNSADAVASLLGCSLGDLALTNVFIRSGEITGGGKFVSGIVGYVGDFDDVSIYRNFNAAAITSGNEYGDIVSGIANLGSEGSAPGSVTIVENENRGPFDTSVTSAIGGGNFAQIVAGSDPSARFDDSAVTVAGNIGTGSVAKVTSINHFGWPIGEFPVVNLAAEVSHQSNVQDYKHFIEANDSTDVLIDPWRLTARMCGSYYQDGATNYAGIINDQITATKPPHTVTVQESCEIWSSIQLDRAITLDLNGKVLDNVFDTYTFNVSADAGGALVKDGTVTFPEGKFSNRPVGDQWTTNNVNAFSWNTNYWDRGIFINGEYVDSLVAISALLGPGSEITPLEDSGFTVDSDSNSILYNGRRAFALAPMGYKVTNNGDGSYTVEIDDDPAVAPEINIAVVPNGGMSKVIVKGARANCEYCLQTVSTLAESWDKPTDVWVTIESDGDPLEFEIDTSAESAFYRIKTRKK